MKNQTAHKGLYVLIGENHITYKPETKRAIDLEILALNVLLFIAIFLFAMDLIAWLLFVPIFYVLAMRVFIANHDRMHANHRIRLPRLLELFAEGFAVVVTPWDEPYDSIKKKHLKHHSTHLSHAETEHGVAEDPHSVYEDGGLFRVVVSCLLYEEIQLVQDIRNGNPGKSRLYRFLIYVPLQIAFIAAFGFGKFIVVFLAMRMVGFFAWFVFSYVIHRPQVYKFGFANHVPKIAKLTFKLLHGRRVTEGCLYHATHHAWPGIPYDQLHRFDAAKLYASGHYSQPDVASFKLILQNWTSPPLMPE